MPTLPDKNPVKGMVPATKIKRPKNGFPASPEPLQIPFPIDKALRISQKHLIGKGFSLLPHGGLVASTPETKELLVAREYPQGWCATRYVAGRMIQSVNLGDLLSYEKRLKKLLKLSTE